jgi:hypothetical protein
MVKYLSREEEKYNFWRGGGGINIIFGSKYRPLKKQQIGMKIFVKCKN